MKSGIIEVVSEICRRTETTIVLGGAAVFSAGNLQHTLNSCRAQYRLCVENVAESHPLPADVERLSTDEVTKLIAVTERVILF
ncbi:MAG: hypothetical protein M1351_06050 [Candidatus Thermoplasmatota archaeon]|nr:hypothetical protein [Candidatus Sysuiplasma jiujiangense]MBX8642541.1 hypothetical protein [Candidatus Sysuiplasma jiujiangense]MCL5253632.1 hypothetical protein [Candidatus Thermoplasmatota archaeon]